MRSGSSCRSLIIQTAFLGDAVLTLPLASALKKNGHFVAVLSRPEIAEVFRSCSSVDEVMLYDKKKSGNGEKNLFKTAAVLKKMGFTHSFLPQRSFRSGLIAFLAGIPVRVGFHRGGARFFLNRKTVFDWRKHESERILSLVSAAGIKAGKIEFNLEPDPEALKKYDELFRGRGRVIGISPESVWPTKKWPLERFAEAAGSMPGDLTPVFLGVSEIRDVPDNALSIAGKTTVKELIAALSRFELLLSNDSGTVHLAAALGVKVIALFGPTVPEMGFTPYGEGHIIIQENLSCRPCGLHGPRKCPRGHFKCMQDISTDKVLEEIVKLL